MAMKHFFVGVKAVIRQDNKILLLKASDKGNFWDVPGGRIDDNESLHETLLRELHEELPSISDIEIGRLVASYRVQGDIKDDISLVLIAYEVQAAFPDGIQLSDEHIAYEWVTLEEAVARGSSAVKVIAQDILDNTSI